MTGTSVRWAANDAWVLTWRNLTVWRRVPAYLVFTIVQPMIFTLLFRYVFGGAIPIPVPGGYGTESHGHLGALARHPHAPAPQPVPVAKEVTA